MTYPYDDDEMYFDHDLNMYVLTPTAAERKGIDLSARVRQKGAVNGEILVRNYLERVSVLVYHYLHTFAIDENIQDAVIAKCPDVRPVIKQALKEQLVYFFQVGDLSRSTDRSKRALAIDETVKEILDHRIAGLGHALTYTGSWCKWRFYV